MEPPKLIIKGRYEDELTGQLIDDLNRVGKSRKAFLRVDGTSSICANGEHVRLLRSS